MGEVEGFDECGGTGVINEGVGQAPDQRVRRISR